MSHFDITMYIDKAPLTVGPCRVVADIGGTNTTYGLMDCSQEKPLLVATYHIKSQMVLDYSALTLEVLELIYQQFNIRITQLCIGAAGVISGKRLRVKPTNLSVTIDVQEIKQATGLEYVLLMNDFEAVGLGVQLVAPESIVTINQGASWPHGHRASVGAGTGLGKVALIWSEHHKAYLPFASEGGHADCSAQTPQEFALFEFIHQERGYRCPISWEDVLSGSGIQRIYRFLRKTCTYPEAQCTVEIAEHDYNPDRISYYAKQGDAHSVQTFQLYAQLYARCLKNFVLDVLALDGVYITGGIASKNVSVFKDPHFFEEFISCGRHGQLLKNIPVFVVTDYHINLYGAIQFMYLHDHNIL